MANGMKIGYAAKKRGDLWTATEANEVKEVVNANADILDGHTSSIETISNTLDETNRQTKANTQNIKTLLADNVKSVWLTQEEYDALVNAGTVDENTEYNIYEEG